MSPAIVLGPPPEFASGGVWPPVASERMVVETWQFTVDIARSELDGVEPARGVGRGAAGSALELILTPTPVRLYRLLKPRRDPGPVRVPEELDDVRTTAQREQRRLVYSQRWERDDPIVQLPPGVTSEKSYTVTTGIEQSRTRDLSQSLGLKTGSPVELSASLGTKFGLQLTLKAQETQTSTLRLANDASDHYRRFAIWSVVHRLEVFAAGGSPQPLASAEVIDADSANLTSADVERPA